MTLPEAPDPQVTGVRAERRHEASLTMYQTSGDDGDSPPAGTDHDGGINIPTYMPKNRDEAASKRVKNDDSLPGTGPFHHRHLLGHWLIPVQT